MVKPMPIKTAPALNRFPRSAMLGIASAVLLFADSAVRAAPEEASSGGLMSSVFSTYGVAILFALVLAGLFVFKKSRSSQTQFVLPERRSRTREAYLAPPTPRPRDATAFSEANTPSHALVPQPERQLMPEVDQSAFGAYRIDQEIGKLVIGKTHRMEVMGSRFPDDRRAIEASLIKVITSSNDDAEARRRAREALEEYGFVARQSAAMLMGRDAWERSSAARTLGQIGSRASLPFLIEALHDGDSVVRNQAVVSLGSLKDPAAIGALLDIARRHADIPASLLSETLSACSVDSLGFLDLPSSDPDMLRPAGTMVEHRDTESFVVFEDLPDGNDDHALLGLLTQLENPDERVRTETVQQLGSYHVQRSVSALSSMALQDTDSGVRAAAVSSLGTIDHESVFAPVLVALGDESREVRAAAARSLTGLHFDRADAYNRVTETASAETLKAVAVACVKTGIATQAIQRLTSEDRRQAYEAFSLMTLLAKAKETQPILDVIENYGDNEIRLCAVRVLNVAGQADVAPKLRDLVAGDRMPESLRTAVLEVLYKFDQQQPVFEQVPE